MTIHFSLWTVLAATVFAALGAGVAVGVMAWEPWDGDDSDVVEPSPTSAPSPVQEPIPTPYERKLTGAEAAAIVKRTLNMQNTARLLTPTAEPPEYFIQLEGCQPVDFNESRKAWIVECDATLTSVESGNDTPLSTQTYRLFDATGKVEPVLAP